MDRISLSMLAGRTRPDFVDVEVSVWAWVGLAAALMVLLCVDLIRHRDDHEPSPREAGVETLAWIGCGLLFGAVVAAVLGGQAFGEYISGYLIEKSLSVDNVFVWSILFSAMAIPVKYQHRVLFWGIFGALALRLTFILVGSALIARFFWLLIPFGLFLVFTGAKIVRHRSDEGDTAKATGLSLLRRVIPVSDELNGRRFLTRINGRRAATPLLAALVVVELTDVVFAVDSVPAVLAVSNEPFLIFASNAFAILGLRAMYFLLANARQRFHYLSHALGGILVFVGIKMTVSHWYHLNTYLSLGVICAMLAAAVVFSERKTRRLAIVDASSELSQTSPARLGGEVSRLVVLLRVLWRTGQRSLVIIGGVALLLGGVAMLVLPGPGLLVIVAGLALLAREFVWARRALDYTKTKAAAGANTVRRATRRQPPTPPASLEPPLIDIAMETSDGEPEPPPYVRVTTDPPGTEP